MRIDAHQHFWKIERGYYYGLTPEAGILYRDYLPEDLLPLLKKNSIDKTIVVEAAHNTAETDYLLQLAEKYDFIVGVVGWLNLNSNNFEDEFTRYRQNRYFVGIRPVHLGPDGSWHPYSDDRVEDDWILRSRVVENLKIVASHDFPLDFNVFPRHLLHILKVLEEVPGLRAVIDHIGKPDIKNRKLEPWKGLMSELSTFKNLWCKLSGMITEAGPNWRPRDLPPYVNHAVNIFGLGRLMYGSDWPVCLQAGSYDQQIEALHEVLTPILDEHSEAAVFGGNAARFYKLS